MVKEYLMNSQLDIQEDTELILRELARHRSYDDITKLLCERSGYRWKEAAALIHRVELEHGNEIQRRRRPLLILLCVPLIVLIIIGCIQFIGNGYALLTGVKVPLIINFLVIEISLPNGGQLAGLFISLTKIVLGVFAINKAIGEIL